MGGRAVECTGLEIRQGRKSFVGSNPTPSANVPNETRAGATPQAPFPSGAGVRSGDDDGQSRIPASPPFAALRCVPRRLTWCDADAMTMAYSALAEAAMVQRL